MCHIQCCVFIARVFMQHSVGFDKIMDHKLYNSMSVSIHCNKGDPNTKKLIDKYERYTFKTFHTLYKLLLIMSFGNSSKMFTSAIRMSFSFSDSFFKNALNATNK